MMLAILTGFIIAVTHVNSTGVILMTKNAEVRLFSGAPLENIEALSTSAYGVINTGSGEIQFGVPVRSFQFTKSLMREHFNENYMESDKFPIAKFKGKLDIPLDITREGEYKVTATGDLEVHGVVKRRSITGTITVDEGQLRISSVFDVKCQDHNIKIPVLVFKNIAETIRVTLKGTFSTVT